MGVEATYVMPYRHGLLKRIQRDLRIGQHYLCTPGMLLDISLANDKGETRNCIRLRIDSTESRIFEWGISDIRYFPEHGILEVDDGKRYCDRDDTNDYANYHDMVCSYYKRLLRECRDANDTVCIHEYDGADVEVIPDYGRRVDENPAIYVNTYSEPVDDVQLLRELPIECMTDDQLREARTLSIIKSSKDKEYDLESAIRTGNLPRVRDLLPDSQSELIKWMRCAVLVRNNTVVNLIAKQIECVHVDDTTIHDLFDIAMKAGDLKTAEVLLQKELRYIPTLRQLFFSASVNIKFFEQVLDRYTEAAFDDTDICRDEPKGVDHWHRLIREEKTYGTPFTMIRKHADFGGLGDMCKYIQLKGDSAPVIYGLPEYLAIVYDPTCDIMFRYYDDITKPTQLNRMILRYKTIAGF
eukprot:gene17793-24167_t